MENLLEKTAEQTEKRFTPETWEALRLYQQAVEDFILEHSDVTPNGALFVKFHADDMQNVRKRIWARFRGWYHRASLEERMAKASQAAERRADFERKKAEKRQRADAERLRRQKAKHEAKHGVMLPRFEREAAEKEVAAINAARYEALKMARSDDKPKYDEFVEMADRMARKAWMPPAFLTDVPEKNGLIGEFEGFEPWRPEPTTLWGKVVRFFKS